MKKVFLSSLNLNSNKLSNKEKKEIEGGRLPLLPGDGLIVGGGTGYINGVCMVRCRCIGEPEKIVPLAQCNYGQMPACLQSYEPSCPEMGLIAQ